MSIWFFINLVIFTFALWKVVGHLHIHTIIGLFGLTFILYNWTRHAMFSTSRSNISRKRKIKFANISKTLLPLHKWTGTSALLFVLLHFVLIFYFFRSEEHTSELQSRENLVCRLLLEKKKSKICSS